MQKEKQPVEKSALADYLFQFLLLFMAVTIGFFVDNWRDEYQENKLAKALASDMQEDLSIDTADLVADIGSREKKEHTLQALFNLVATESSSPNDSTLYQLSSYINFVPHFSPNEGTYEQLTNAGYLSYFDKEVAQEMTSYYLACRQTAESGSEELYLINQRVIPFLQLYFHTENFVSWRTQNQFIAPLSLNGWNPQAQWQFHNLINEVRHQNTLVLHEYQLLKQKATHLIATLHTAQH